ncbi:MAG: hypothetical protein QGD92_06515 [Gammaproteobacteria bacterium]|nr:hypothetical protein [Gammaproteobacteria bacterium]
MIKSSPVVLFVSILLLLAGCSNEETVNTSTTDDTVSQVANGTPATRPPITAPKRQASIQGLVVSVQNAANYSYLEIKTADDNLLWLAAPETPVHVNDTVSWQRGSLMRNFTSSALGRTFPEIYFVTAVQVEN